VASPLLILALTLLLPAAEDSAPAPVTSLRTADDTPLLKAAAILTDAAASDSLRQSAADLILARCVQPDPGAAFDIIKNNISQPVSGAGATRYILISIQRTSRVTPQLYGILIQRLSAAPEWEIPAILPSFVPFRTRETCELLISYAASTLPEISQEAMNSLAELSGEDGRVTFLQWRTWLNEVRSLSEIEWQSRLADNLGRRASRLSRERNASAERLVSQLRSSYLDSPAPDRPALLTTWLADDLPEVRDLGLELTRRELSVTGRLDPSIGPAALRLLRNPDPSVRARASVLVRQLAPEGAPVAVLEALKTENDPLAAADLLLAASRWPSPECVSITLEWMEFDGPAGLSAAEACSALARAAVLSADQRLQSLEIARRLAAERISAPVVCLLTVLGDDADLATLPPLLESPQQPLRHAASEALIWDSRFASQVVDAAVKFPDLFDAASRAILIHEPTAEGFLRVASLEAPSAEARRSGLVRLSRRVPAPDLLTVAPLLNDPALSRTVLSIITSPERVMAERSRPEALRAISEAALTQAQEDLKVGNPNAALSIIESIPGIDDVADSTTLARTRVLALISLGRIDLALEQKAPCTDWFDGLALIKGSPHERDVIRRITTQFTEEMTKEQRAIIAQAEDRLAHQDQSDPTDSTPPR
jgi:hypothetical protein